MSMRATSTAHARIFGLSLAALLAACLVLNAASPSTRVCQPSDRDFVTTGSNSISGPSRVVPVPAAGSHGEPLPTLHSTHSATIHSKECATNEGRAEPGY